MADLYAPINSPNFQGRPSVTFTNGLNQTVTVPIATLQDVADLKNAWSATVAQRVMELFYGGGNGTVVAAGGSGASSPVSSRMTMGMIRMVPNLAVSGVVMPDVIGSLTLNVNPLFAGGSSQILFSGNGSFGTNVATPAQIVTAGFDVTTYAIRFINCPTASNTPTFGEIIITPAFQTGSKTATQAGWTLSSYPYAWPLTAAAALALANYVNWTVDAPGTMAATIAAMTAAGNVPGTHFTEANTYIAGAGNTSKGPFNCLPAWISAAYPMVVQPQFANVGILYYCFLAR